MLARRLAELLANLKRKCINVIDGSNEVNVFYLVTRLYVSIAKA